MKPLLFKYSIYEENKNPKLKTQSTQSSCEWKHIVLLIFLKPLFRFNGENSILSVSLFAAVVVVIQRPEKQNFEIIFSVHICERKTVEKSKRKVMCDSTNRIVIHFPVEWNTIKETAIYRKRNFKKYHYNQMKND
jgi:hypothetical protein